MSFNLRPNGGNRIFPIDVTELLRATLAENRREPDGKLHPSGALTGSLRHLQLEAAGAPTLPPDLVSEVNLLVGTEVHSFFERMFRGRPVMTEVKLDDYMPEGWSGTADWIAWNPELRGFVLGDLKTCKPGAIPYLIRGGSKESQIWQVSCYWHALADMGIPLVNGFCIYHLPKSQMTAREGSPVEPVMNWCLPIPRDVLYARMAERKAAVDAYVESLTSHLRGTRRNDEDWLTPELAPVQSRDVDLVLNKTLKRPVIDVKLSPNWSTAYCPFPDELCDCRRQGVNKVGSWDRDDAGLLVFTPAKGHENLTPPQPEPALVAAMVKAQTDKAWTVPPRRSTGLTNCSKGGAPTRLTTRRAVGNAITTSTDAKEH